MLVIRNLSAKITNTVAKIVKLLFNLLRHLKQCTERRKVHLFHESHQKPPSKQWDCENLSQKEKVCEFSSSDTKVKIACIVVLVILVLVYLILSAMIRVISEGWTFHESMYFWFITLTTVGFGDFVPYDGREPDTIAVLILYYIGTFYLLVGLALIASLIQCIVGILEGRLPAVGPAPTQQPNATAQKEAKTEGPDHADTKTHAVNISQAIWETSSNFIGLILVRSEPSTGEN